MFSKIKAVLIDLSGTIHIENNEIPGSIRALKRLKESSLEYLFVTNTTKECQHSLHSRLTNIGFEIDRKKIFTSLIAARDFIKTNNLRPHLMIENSALEDFQSIIQQQNSIEKDDDSRKEAVVIGLSPEHFDYPEMNIAFNKLLNGAKLVAIHQGRYYKTSNGLSLGPGPFVKALQYAADVQTVIQVGKPEAKFFLSALDCLEKKFKPEEVVMIGDDVRDDVQGAQNAGMKGILVRTGKYRNGDENKIIPGPNLIVSCFEDALNVILEDVSQSS